MLTIFALFECRNSRIFDRWDAINQEQREQWSGAESSNKNLSLRDQLGLPDHSGSFGICPFLCLLSRLKVQADRLDANDEEKLDTKRKRNDCQAIANHEEDSSRLSSILNMPAVRMAIESKTITSIFDDYEGSNEAYALNLDSEGVRSSDTTNHSIRYPEIIANTSDAMLMKGLSSLKLSEGICRRLDLPAMEDPSATANDQRLATVGGWVRTLSLWIETVSEGRPLNKSEADEVDRLQRALEDGCLVAVLSALVQHSQVGVQEYAAELLGRLYVAPLMEAQSEPAQRAARLDGLMRRLEQHGAVRACLDVLAPVDGWRNETVEGGTEGGREEASNCDESGKGDVEQWVHKNSSELARAEGAESVLPCTILSLLNCLQSVVTFRPEILADVSLCRSLVRTLAGTCRRASAEAYRRALSVPRAAAAVPLLCGGRTAADAAAAVDEGMVWAWEVRESAGMTLAQVCAANGEVALARGASQVAGGSQPAERRGVSLLKDRKSAC